MIKKNDNGYLVDIRPQGREGKRIRKTFKTKPEALAFEKWAIAEYSQKDWQPKKKDKRTLADLASTWHKQHGCTLKTGKKRLADLLNIANDMGNPIAANITAKTYTDYRARRLLAVSPNTANHDLTYLRALFNELRRMGEIDYQNPLADVRKIKHDQQELGFLDSEQITALLEQLDKSPTSHARLQAKLCLSTGARWGEVANLPKSAIRNNKVTYTATKNGKNRTIPISKELAVELEAAAPLTDGLNTFKRAVKSIGLELPRGQSTHILRHTFASHFMMNGGNIVTLQKILGHGSIMMTMRYAHLSPEHLNEALELNPIAKK